MITLFALSFSHLTQAQDRTVLFDLSSAGVTRAITNWGMSVTWPSYENMRRTLVFMGTNETDFVHLPFLANQPLTNGNLSPTTQAELTTHINVANIAGNKPWSMSIGTEAGVDPWYKNGGDVIAIRWVQAMEAAQRFFNKPIIFCEPFNEPDYGWGQGTVQNLYDILGLLQTSTNFAGTVLAGGSTLNCDSANAWYDPIKSRVTAGTTHALAGTFNGYAGFMQNVIASADRIVIPEAHNLMEILAAVEYGPVDRAMYWGAAELARGELVKACQGKRLAYSEDRPKWTAAAVYRANNGAVQAFIGASERMATTTTYQFFSKDRDVFYDGDGPRRDYTLTIPGGSGYMTPDQRNAEKLVRITSGPDVQPLIKGRYIVVNRNSSKVMEVAGASTTAGANIQQNTYTGSPHQQWDFLPLPPTNGGDFSYFAVTAAHSTKSVDVQNWGLDNGANVMQWDTTGGHNQHWYLEYVSNGWFHIRSRWSGKYLDVSGASTANGANIHQWSGNGGFNQQWRLLPVGASPTDLSPPAPVTGLTAIANPRSVRLTWTASTATDLAGYTVLRSTTSGGPFEIVARGSTNTSFTDKSANQNRAYYYLLKAVDRSWNSSANSAQVSATPSGRPAIIARYPLDAALSDSSTNANHPIVTNGSPAFAAGKYGSSLDLDGSSHYVMLPANMLAGVTNFTIALWVNWDGGSAWQRILDFGNNTAEYLFLTPSSGSGTLRFAITTNSSGGEQIVETAALPTGIWQHVAVTRNGNTLKLYRNGQPAATNGQATIAPAHFDPALNYLAKSQWPDPLFNGRLDELHIYNYCLSDAEVARLTSNLPPPPSEPTSLVSSPLNGMLNISWPADYLGSRLQVQTNALMDGLGTNWHDVTGSASVNGINVPIVITNGSVFYRLVYP